MVLAFLYAINYNVYMREYNPWMDNIETSKFKKKKKKLSVVLFIVVIIILTLI